jgi:ribosomal protein S12 methylthiotransferase
MRRPSRLEMIYDHVEKLRAAMPDIALRTTFIVGYPGETEEEFQGLLAFAQAIEFDKVGAFPFSPEPGTPAAELPDPVPEEVKEERYARLMEAQQPISLRKNQEQVGRVLDILVEGEGEIAQADGFDEHFGGQDATPMLNQETRQTLVLGRSYRDAPEVDGLVLVPGIADVPAGAMLQVHINGAMEYDLVGEPLIAETFSSGADLLAEFK